MIWAFEYMTLLESFSWKKFPPGIIIAPCRMLEAAFLGVPYEGRIPDFSQAEAAEPMSPSVMAGRQLRQEQDQAYQDSLQVQYKLAIQF